MTTRKWLAVGLSAAAALVLGGSRPAAAQTPDDTSYKNSVGPQTPDTNDPDGDSAENPRGRSQWRESRVNGPLPPAFSRDFVASGKAARSAHHGSLPAGGAGAWLSLGPTNANQFQNGVTKPAVDSGRLRNILPDPRNANVVYVLSSSGGLWKTTNFQANKPTWTPTSDFLFAESGGSAAFGRTPDVIYLGSGDPFEQGVGGFVYKSVDGAVSWNDGVFLPGVTTIHDIKVDTSQGSTTANDIVLVATDAGLYRSADGGATFTLSADINAFPPFATEVWSLAPTSAGWIASAAVWVTCPNCDDFTVVYFSTDHGATWSFIPDAGTTAISDFSVGRTTLAANPGSNVVYAEVANNDGSNQVDIYKSTDGGLDWAALGVNAKTPTNPNVFNPDMNLMHGQAWYNQMIMTDPADTTGNTVYAGGNLSSAVSRDGGNTWTLLSSWLGQYSNKPPGPRNQPAQPIVLPYVHADFHAGAVSLIGGKKTIFFGSDGGLFYSTDNGKSFQNNANEGLVTHLIYALASGTKDSNNMLIGLQDNGTRYRVSSTTTWRGSIGGDGFGVGWSQANNDFSFGSYTFLKIYRSSNNPPNEQTKFVNLRDSTNLGDYTFDSNFVTPFASPTAASDPTGARFFTYTNHFILGTADGGDTWNEVWVSGDSSIIRPDSFAVGLEAHDLDDIAAIGNAGLIRYTTDGGSTWTSRNVITLLPGWQGFNSTITISKNPSDPAHPVMYVGSENVALGTPHIAKSLDGGNTWTDVTQWVVFPVNKLLVDPNDANVVYASTWIGVVYTTDGGASWDFLGPNLPLVEATDLYLSPDGSFLRTATYGRGVWQINLH